MPIQPPSKGEKMFECVHRSSDLLDSGTFIASIRYYIHLYDLYTFTYLLTYVMV